MKQINNLKVSDKIFNLINENFHIEPKRPMTFYITDYNGSQHKAWKKMLEVCEYFKKHYNVEYKEVSQYKVFVAFTINEPICANLERFIMDRDGIKEL